MNGLIKEILSAQTSGLKAALCTIVKTEGSTPRKAGAKMIVYENGTVKDSVGGGAFEKKVIEEALIQIAANSPKLIKHDLHKQHKMCCGGSMEVFIEPIMKRKFLYIFGAGHTGRALAKLATDFDFEVSLIDDRKDQLDLLDAEAVTKLNLLHSEILPTLLLNENSYVIIMTYDHDYDREILAYCLKYQLAYLGMIGSRRKVIMTKKRFIDKDIATHDDLSKVDMPMGIDINATSPKEIAISILAKLIQVKNQVPST